MVVKFNKSILGEDWLQSFSLFRLNPEAFLDKRKLTRDSFCFDVLKELYLDHIEIQNKIHLLLLLQEHSALLIKDTNLLEQVVGSLTNLCNILGTKSDKRLLKSQTLITIVTILLSQNLDDDAPQLIAKVKTLLLETIYNVSEDSTVISTGCKCLEELEEFFPGILESEITNIYVASEQEMSPALQSYILLLSMCVKHSAMKLYDESSALQVETGASKKSDVIQISPFVSHLLEQIPYMTHTAVYRVLKNLIFVVKHTPELSPMTFKLYLQNLIMSSDVPLFHLVFDLLEAFGSALVSPQDETYLFKQLMKMSTHPCLSSYHRLLYLDWLKICVVNKKIIVCKDKLWINHSRTLRAHNIIGASPFRNNVSI